MKNQLFVKVLICPMYGHLWPTLYSSNAFFQCGKISLKKTKEKTGVDLHKSGIFNDHSQKNGKLNPAIKCGGSLEIRVREYFISKT